MNTNTARKFLTMLAAAGAALMLSGTVAAGAESHTQGTPTEGRVCEIKLDVNRATAAELGQIPGVRGPAAFGIVDYRETHGPYRDVVELLRAKDVDALTFSSLRDKVEIVAGGALKDGFATSDGAYVWSCKQG